MMNYNDLTTNYQPILYKKQFNCTMVWEQYGTAVMQWATIDVSLDGYTALCVCDWYLSDGRHIFFQSMRLNETSSGSDTDHASICIRAATNSTTQIANDTTITYFFFVIYQKEL